MLFNSFEFAVFLPLVFILYWFVFARNIKLQNLLIVVASYVFYGWWDWRFLSLIFISSLVDFLIGKRLHSASEKSHRKLLLSISLIVNLGFLGFFKYYNFFVDSFIAAFGSAGVTLSARTLNIILPVGISFYTFQTLSYTLDVYYKRTKAVFDPIAFFAFVSFFPQLVAGPIERASKLLPQFERKRIFEYKTTSDGCRQILLGFFKKIVIADNASIYVEHIFDKHAEMPSGVLVLGAILFAFQIYGDFSGYSDIAIGTARLFGFNLMQNFAFPYFSKDMAEFWRRWHISLSTWLRDYLFLPIAYSSLNKIKTAKIWGIKAEIIAYSFAIFITWFLGGLWHGANWTFVIWGSIHGLYLIISHLTKKTRRRTLRKLHLKKSNPGLVFFQIIGTFALVSFAWIFFRAENINVAFEYIQGIFQPRDFEIPKILYRAKSFAIILSVFIIIEFIQKSKKHSLEISNLNIFLRWFIYIFIFLTILLFGNFNQTEFIYFQF